MSGLNKTGPWLKDPRQPRKDEVIGGGFFVFRRGDSTGRIRPSQWPFEYPDLGAAKVQAERLAIANPGLTFDVVQVVASEICLTEKEAAE